MQCIIADWLFLQLHIDSHHDPTSPEAKEVDFFAEHADSSQPASEPVVNEPMTEGQRLTQPISIQNGKKEAELGEGEGPNVEHALSMSPTEALAKAEPRKALIGNKKTGTKKGVSLLILFKYFKKKTVFCMHHKF